MNSGGNSILNFFTKPIIVGLFFSFDVVIVRFYIYPKYYPFLVNDFSLIQNFIEWFGVAYGLFIALVLVNVWTQFDNTEREFDREADAIFMLYQSVKQIKPSTLQIKKQIVKLIVDYIEHVVQNYMIEYQKLDVRDVGDAILEEIRDKIGLVVHSSEKQAITAELIKELNDAIDVRGDRISKSKQRIPSPVWTISLTSSILWLIPFFGLNFINDWIAIVLVGGVTLIVIAILAIIKDLDDPFEGTWKIDSFEWDLLNERIGYKPTLIFVFNVDNNFLSKFWWRLNEMFLHRLCPLYSILKNDEYKRILQTKIGKNAHLRFLFKNEFEDMNVISYENPTVVCKTGSKSKEFLSRAELSGVKNIPELARVIRSRLREV